jgi:hypothetical protein
MKLTTGVIVIFKNTFQPSLIFASKAEPTRALIGVDSWPYPKYYANLKNSNICLL